MFGDSEYSLGSNGAAEGMHKAVLVDLDQRPNAVKASFDISNAHNEFCREAAVKEVQTHIPTMLPWLKGHLVTKVSHVYLGDDGTHHEISKSSGGDQGDAVTAVLFPLVYRKVTLALRLGVITIDGRPGRQGIRLPRRRRAHLYDAGPRRRLCRL